MIMMPCVYPFEGIMCSETEGRMLPCLGDSENAKKL